ncbi:MAG: PIN domain-containing protein [Isosphaeraceae bacterium]
MILLDTDILTLFFSGHEKVVKRARDEDEELAITVVTRYEILLGRFAFLLKASSEAQILRAQEWLSRSEKDLAPWRTLGVSPPVGDLFDQLRAEKSIRKIGRADLLIACIALAHRARLVTRNTRHFLPINGLRVENWAD